MGQKEVENENYCGVFEMRDLARFFSEVLTLDFLFLCVLRVLCGLRYRQLTTKGAKTAKQRLIML